MTRRTFGTIRNRGGVQYIRYRVGGHEYEERAGTVGQAEKLLARREAELTIGAFTAPDVKRTTYEDLETMIRDDYRANQRKSTEQLACALKHLARVFAGQRALTITADRLKRYLADRLESGAAPATIRNEFQALRHAFQLAKDAGKVVHIPLFPKFKADRVRTGFFEESDVAHVLAQLSPDLAPVADFAYLTGWRKGEILSLTWAQVDFASGIVRLEPGTTKNGEGREFPFASLPPLRALLERQRERTKAVARRTGRIVTHVFHREGMPIRDFKVAWDSACDRAARDANGVIVRPYLIGRLVHDFRRTAVRNLERAGVPRSVAMKLTGHKTEAVYRRYAIVADQDQRDGVAKLARLHELKGTTGGHLAVGAEKSQ